MAFGGVIEEVPNSALVRLYLERAGFGHVAAETLADGRSGDPLVAVIGRT